jgi:hypothetical protein
MATNCIPKGKAANRSLAEWMRSAIHATLEGAEKFKLGHYRQETFVGLLVLRGRLPL